MLAKPSSHIVRTLGALPVGLLLVFLPWSTWPSIPGVIQEALPKAGDALLIAVLLAFLVDRSIKTELLEKFTKDVSHHIVGNLLPPQLRDHMLKYLTKSIIRRAWSIDYTIEPATGCSRCIQLTTLSQYQIENLSSLPVEYTSEYEVEETWRCQQSRAEIKTFRVVAPTDAECRTLEGTDLQCRNQNDHLLASTTVRIPASPHGTYRFLSESVEHFPDAFESSFIAAHAVLGCTVTVFYPKDEFVVNLYLSCDDRGMTAKRVELAKGTRWEVDCPLLPGQSILVSWQRLNAMDRPVLETERARAIAANEATNSR